MEHFGFSDQGLAPKVLEKEEKDFFLKVERVREALDRDVDFKTIVDIVLDIYKKCFPQIPEVITSKIEIMQHPRYEVHYALPNDINQSKPTLEDEAYFDGKTIHYSAALLCNEKGEPDVNRIIKVSIHELLHSVTFKEEEGSFFSGVLHQKKVGEKTYAKFFDSFNEGLTEVIADAIFAEYTARKGSIQIQQNEEMLSLWEGVSLDIPSRYLSYHKERVYVARLLYELKVASGVAYDDVVKAIIREYFTNGYLLRDEIASEFKKFPQVLGLLERFKRNVFEPIPEDEIEFLISDITTTEADFIKAIFGRDVIGRYNRKVISELYE